MRSEIARRYPKVLRRVGGYNLDEFVDAGRPFNLARLIVGSEGTLGVVVEARIGLVPLPAAKAVLAIQFDDLLDAFGATPAILRHGPSAIEAMDAFILNHTRTETRTFTGCDRRSWTVSRPRSCASSLPGTTSRSSYRGSTRSKPIFGRAGLAVRCHRAIEPAAQQAIWHVREVGARAVDGHEGRCQGPVVR